MFYGTGPAGHRSFLKPWELQYSDKLGSCILMAMTRSKARDRRRRAIGKHMSAAAEDAQSRRCPSVETDLQVVDVDGPTNIAAKPPVHHV